MRNEIFQLAENRKLGYAIYGPGDARPVIYFHGTPASRLEPLLVNAFGMDLDDLLYQNNLQLIAIDRPGIGLSTFNPAGDFSSFGNDVVQLLQFLRIPRTSVMCWSGGGPFAFSYCGAFPGNNPGGVYYCGFHFEFQRSRCFQSNACQ